jgi:hypothetical protein
MTLLAEEPWTWTLYADGDRSVLSVMIGGHGMWELAVELTTDEIAAYEASGIAGLDALVQGIQVTPDAYMPRRVASPRPRLR